MTDRFARIERDLFILKVMVGAVIGGVVGVILLLLRH
jgi:hypothetical protein